LELFRDPAPVNLPGLTKDVWHPFILSGLLCFGFGAFHLSGLFGPGMWVSDPYGLTGSVQPSHRSGDQLVLTLSWWRRCSYAAGIVGIIAGLFHLTVRPPERLYKALRMGNIETVLSSSIAAVSSRPLSLLVRCGTVMPPHRLLFGPTAISGIKIFPTEIDQRIQAGVAEVKVSGSMVTDS